jgi:predicted nucleic acid-binding protein
MSGRYFLDTNILVYAVELGGEDPAKAETARNLVTQGDPWISTHVLGEFYVAVTSPRRAHPLSHRHAVAWIQFWKRFQVCGLTSAHVDLALDLVTRFGLGYYDALVLAAASLADCSLLYSEDLSDRQICDTVQVCNPFCR